MAQLPTTPIEDRIVEYYGGGPYIQNVATSDLNKHVTSASTPAEERTTALDELHRRAWADFTDTTSEAYRDSVRSTDAVIEILIDADIADYDADDPDSDGGDSTRIALHRDRRTRLTDDELIRVRAASWVASREKRLAREEIERRIALISARFNKLHKAIS